MVQVEEGMELPAVTVIEPEGFVSPGEAVKLAGEKERPAQLEEGVMVTAW